MRHWGRLAAGVSALLLAGGIAVGATAASAGTSASAGAAAPGAGGKVIGYYPEWGVYARNYHVKNVQTSGSASKLTHINYAFGNVTEGKCALGDTYADYDKFYDAASSVDGKSDTWDAGALRGNFNQLRKLKKMHPGLKVIFSFGGWTWSGGFGKAAANAKSFADSCYKLVKDPRWADVFDGIDIDWEYPNACGLSCDTSGKDAFKKLLGALRSRFGGLLVTAAITADASAGGKMDAADYAGAAGSVNWFNVMTYDFFGVDDYKVLKGKCPSNGTIAGTAYCFKGGQWWSYDTPSTIAGKMSFAKSQGLGGAFFWELSGDTTSGELINAIRSHI